MNRAESIAYLRKLKQQELEGGGVIPVNKRDIEETMQDLEPFRDFTKEKRHETLTSDE